MHEPEAVIHLAAQASVPKSWEAPDLTYQVNVLGTSNLLEALKMTRHAKTLLVGSAQVYGMVELERPLRETDPLQPNSPYAVSKVCQELLGRLYFSEFGIPILMSRAFNHTGPGQRSEFAIGSFCSQIAALEAGRADMRMRVGPLNPVRDFLDVRDVVDAYRLLIEAGVAGETYNVSSGRGYPIGDLLEILLKASEVGAHVTLEEDKNPRPGDSRILIGDNSKIRSAIGWQPRIPIRQSLLDTLEWYRRRRTEARGTE